MSGWVGGRWQGSLLTRQMEWVTGGSGDEEADPRFMNKCKHSGAQITAAGHLVWVGVPGRRWGPGRVGEDAWRHPYRSNLMKTGKLLGRLIVYTVKATGEDCRGLSWMKAQAPPLENLIQFKHSVSFIDPPPEVRSSQQRDPSRWIHLNRS